MLKNFIYTIAPLLALPLASVVGMPMSPPSEDGPKVITYPLVSSAWYVGWHSDKFPLSSINWDKYNTLIYSFAQPTSDVTQLSFSPSDANLFPQFVAQAHQHNVKAHIAIGGAEGSQFFSTAVATNDNRMAFVKTVVDFVKNYTLDGVNFDWEYPTGPNDTNNFLLFLQALRADPTGAKLTITAATDIKPFIDASGSPSTNVAGFASVFDYIQIMSYDLTGPWSAHVGPNAPLVDSCVPTVDRTGSAVSAVEAWMAAGMPKEKIVLAVAAYGHSFRVKPSDAFVGGISSNGLAAYPPVDATNPSMGDAWDVGSANGHTGLFTMWGLVANGFLTPEGKPANGISYRYDECSMTPYVYNPTSQVMVSFDDVTSFTAKGLWIKFTGLRGFSIWEAGGDYNNLLQNSIYSGMHRDSIFY